MVLDRSRGGPQKSGVTFEVGLTLGDGADFEVGFGLRGRDNTRRLKFTLECWGWLEKRGRTSEVGVDVGLGADPAG